MRRNILGRTAAVGVLAICTGCTSSVRSFARLVFQSAPDRRIGDHGSRGDGRLRPDAGPARAGGERHVRVVTPGGQLIRRGDEDRVEGHAARRPDQTRQCAGRSNQVAADLHCHAGYFFETQKKYAEASSHYRDAMTKSPRDARALAGYGRVQDQLGNRIEADQYLMKACEVAPQDPGPRGDLAQSSRGAAICSPHWSTNRKRSSCSRGTKLNGSSWPASSWPPAVRTKQSSN